MAGIEQRRQRLRADCRQCVGLCCVATAFSASSDFAITKQAEEPCPHLGADFRCDTHSRLREAGFPGCRVFDCFGAGQQVTQQTFSGRSWRDDEIAKPMFAAFTVMRQLHETMWYLNETLALPEAMPLHADVAGTYDDIERLTRLPSDVLVKVDIDHIRGRAAQLLRQASVLARSEAPQPEPGLSPEPDLRTDPSLDNVPSTGKLLRGANLVGTNLDGADLSGHDLRGADLRRASLRSTVLLGVDLRAAILTRADLTAADLRGAHLAGADMAGALFLTQSQIEAALGDEATLLPTTLSTPSHWRAAAV